MTTESILIQGMADQNDVDKVSHALHEVWGVRKVEVSLEQGQVVFTYDENSASLIDFQQAVLDSGFEIYRQNGELEEKKIR